METLVLDEDRPLFLIDFNEDAKSFSVHEVVIWNWDLTPKRTVEHLSGDLSYGKICLYFGDNENANGYIPIEDEQGFDEHISMMKALKEYLSDK